MSKLATPPGGQKMRFERAFTLTEMLVSFLMLVLLLTAVLVIFERSARLGRDQVEVAAIQQNSRIAHSELLRHVRMAGAGGLPISWKYLPKPATPDGDTLVKVNSPGAFPNGFAVAIRNNSPGGLRLPSDRGGATHLVLPGSDILTVRGAFTMPVYFYHPPVQSKDWYTSGDVKLDPIEIEIPNRIGSDFRTSLKPLIDFLQSAKPAGEKPARPVLFLVRDLMNPDAYGVLKWNHESAANRLTVEDCTSNNQISGTQDGFKVGCIVVSVELDPAKRYASLGLGSSLAPDAGSPFYPMATSPHGSLVFPHQFGSIAVLQEYRYYVRAEFEIPGDKTSRLAPVLSRTEYFPSTELLPLAEDFIETIDVVDNVIDMQIVAGIDRDWSISAAGHGVVTENLKEASSDTRNEDEILFNHPDDMDEPPGGLTAGGAGGGAFDGLGYANYVRWFHPKLDVYFLRISTLTQSARPDLDYAGSDVGEIEDVDRSVAFDVDGQVVNYNEDKKYRRRLLQSVAELRNLK